jgi:hypothetical protein
MDPREKRQAQGRRCDDDEPETEQDLGAEAQSRSRQGRPPQHQGTRDEHGGHRGPHDQIRRPPAHWEREQPHEQDERRYSVAEREQDLGPPLAQLHHVPRIVQRVNDRCKRLKLAWFREVC